MKEIDYEKAVLQSAEEEYKNFRQSEIKKPSIEVFDDSEHILQYRAALLALKKKKLTQTELRILYTMRGRILRTIVEPETAEKINYDL